MPTLTRLLTVTLSLTATIACGDSSSNPSSTTTDADSTTTNTSNGGGTTADTGLGTDPQDSGTPPPDTTPDTTVADTATEDAEPDMCPPFTCEDFVVACEGPDCPTPSNYSQVIPSAGLPAEAEIQLANNNLDVVRHEGRIYMAFRTAPYHFADAAATLHVFSSEDERTWSFETSINLETDLREPRLLSWDGRLLLYFAVLGTQPFAFEPQGMMVSEQRAPGDWTEAEWFHEPGFIPWRTKVVDGIPYMIAYEGGENIYDLTNGDPIEVHWLTTTDGVNWTPAIPDQPVVLSGGCSETDFVVLNDGTLIAVSRNEAGDPESGWGSKICRAEADNLGQWACISDPRKYDSPLLFTHHDRVYLVGRRNVTDTGHYDLGGDDLPPAERTSRNLLNYSNTPKRCALWEVDPDELSVTLLFDLPSRGDTCFPGVIHLGDSRYAIYNYTSPFNTERDPSWIEAQSAHTFIYRVEVTFPP